MDSVAVSYAGELARWGIETSIVVPGAFTKGTHHFTHSGKPGRPHGQRPFRVHIDPSANGATVIVAVADRIRAEFLRRVGVGDLLLPRVS